MKTRSTATNQRRSHIPFLASSVVLLMAAAACGKGADVTGNPLEGSRWEMTSVRDGNALVAAIPTTIATAEFADGQAFGSTGCNGYRFSYAFDGNSITFKDPVLSGSACNSDRGRQSDALIQAMQATERFVLSGDGLEFTDAAGAAQVLFRPTTELPLTRVAWQLAWYGDGTSPLEGTQISLVFRDDGTLTGIAGCNSYFADYEIDADQLVIRAVARTEMACTDPDGVMTQETDYLNALDRAVALTTTLTGLELSDADGHPVAEYRFGGRIRNEVSGATDSDQELEEAAFIGLTRDAAIQLAVDHGRLWRISRQDDEYFTHDAQLLFGRVTFEIDNGKVTSASIEGETPPDPGNDLVEDPTQANLIADSVKRLLTIDNSFDRADVFDDIRIATVIGADPDQPLQFLDLETIAVAIEEFGTVRFIDDADAEINTLFEESPNGIAVVSVERLLFLGDRAQVEMRLWCGSLCGVFLTYDAESQDGEWNIIGTIGPIAMS